MWPLLKAEPKVGLAAAVHAQNFACGSVLMLLVGLQPVFLPNIACPRDGASGLPVLKILSKQPCPIGCGGDPISVGGVVASVAASRVEKTLVVASISRARCDALSCAQLLSRLLSGADGCERGVGLARRDVRRDARALSRLRQT